MCRSGCEHRPGSLAVRFVFGGWWLFCIIIIATYGANHVAFLAVTQRTLPFNSLEELNEQTEYTMGVLGGTAYVAAFKVTSTYVSRRSSSLLFAPMILKLPSWSDVAQ